MDLIKFCQVAGKNIINYIGDMMDMISMRSWLYTALIFSGKGGKIWIDAVPTRARHIGTNIRKFKIFAEKDYKKCSRYSYKILNMPMMLHINDRLDDVSAMRGLARSGRYKIIPELMERVKNKDSDILKFWICYTGNEKLIKKYAFGSDWPHNLDPASKHAEIAVTAFCYGGHLHLIKLINSSRGKYEQLKYAFKSLNYEVIMYVFRKFGSDYNTGNFLKYALKSKHITGLLLTSMPLVHWHNEFKIDRKILEEARERAIEKNYETLPMIEQLCWGSSQQR